MRSREDLDGRPFVGPAGRLLDDAIAAAGLVRGDSSRGRGVPRAVAGRAVFGRPVRISQERGQVQVLGDRLAVITTHPSAVVRLHGEPDFPKAFDALVADLSIAVGAASATPH